MLVKEHGNIVIKNENEKQPKMYVLDTVGSNLIDILGLDYIDATKTYSNDIREMAHVLGIEAARESILNEFKYVISASGGSSINDHHLSLLCDRMTCNSKLIAISRHGINNDDIGPIAKASFEETPEMLLKAAMFAEFDSAKGVSCNVMLGQPGQYGTNAFDIMTDIDQLRHTEIKNTETRSMELNLESSMCDTIEIKENLGSINEVVENKDFAGLSYVLDL
jgi:DNA-directed RNA polymerase II subunit RPB1